VSKCGGALSDGGDGDAVARPHGQQAAQHVLTLRRQHHIRRNVILRLHDSLQGMRKQLISDLCSSGFERSALCCFDLTTQEVFASALICMTSPNAIPGGPVL